MPVHWRMCGPALVALITVGCGGADGGDEGFPSRDWSGTYAVQVLESKTDCVETEEPPPLGELEVEVRQTVDNDVRVVIGPFVSMGGRFAGDELEAAGEISQPISLPDSMLSRVSESDSLDTIVYRLEATFGDDALRGRYRIRAPDLVALARDSPRRCDIEYEVRGSLLGSASEVMPATEAPGGRP